MKKRTIRRIASAIEKPRRVPKGCDLCGIDGCERFKRKTERACWKHEFKGPEILEMERRLHCARMGEVGGKAPRKNPVKPAAAGGVAALGAVFEGGGATLPLPGVPEGL